MVQDRFTILEVTNDKIYFDFKRDSFEICDKDVYERFRHGKDIYGREFTSNNVEVSLYARDIEVDYNRSKEEEKEALFKSMFGVKDKPIAEDPNANLKFSIPINTLDRLKKILDKTHSFIGYYREFYEANNLAPYAKKLGMEGDVKIAGINPDDIKVHLLVGLDGDSFDCVSLVYNKSIYTALRSVYDTDSSLSSTMRTLLLDPEF